MKIKTFASSLAVAISLATGSHAAISTYLTQTTVSDGASLHMNWNSTTFWSAEVGVHTGSEPLYLTAASYNFDPFEFSFMYQQGYIGSWSGTALSLSTTFIAAGFTVDGSLSYSNYIDLTPVDGTASTYAGLRYNLGGGNYHYGWVNYSTNSESTEITLLGAGFNTIANEPVQAGQTTAVPEPSAAWIGGLFAGIALFRRRVGR